MQMKPICTSQCTTSHEGLHVLEAPRRARICNLRPWCRGARLCYFQPSTHSPAPWLLSGPSLTLMLPHWRSLSPRPPVFLPRSPSLLTMLLPSLPYPHHASIAVAFLSNASLYALYLALLPKPPTGSRPTHSLSLPLASSASPWPPSSQPEESSRKASSPAVLARTQRQPSSRARSRLHRSSSVTSVCATCRTPARVFAVRCS